MSSLTPSEDPGAVPRSASLPLWLLDVDAVLNAVTGKPDRRVWPDWQSGTARANGRMWPIWFSPTVTTTIRRLHESGLVEARWLSSWGQQANDDLRPLLDLPELTVAGELEDFSVPVAAPVAHRQRSGAVSHGQLTTPAPGRWWKLAAVQQVVDREPGRALLWTDDELRRQPSALTWVRRHVPASLLLAPRFTLGLTPKLLANIQAFCRDPEAPRSRILRGQATERKVESPIVV